ncbi:MAG: methionine adenosyltransferase [Desulfobacterales bacterium]|jgi:S-adenosylmethionine synthetase
MIRNFIFTSESVTEGHPDKLCDQISDAIVDFFLNQDPHARVRAECAVSSAIVFIAARFRSKIKMDFSRIARRVIRRIGYEQEDFNDKICSILTTPNALPVEEKDLFDEKELTDKEIAKIPARNQVTVFGFACNHTPTLLPYPIWLAHRLARQLTAVRRIKTLPYLMPDGKVQVGVEFKARQPQRIHSVTITANQRDFKKPSLRKLRTDIREQVVMPVLEDEPIRPDRRTKIIVNPDGPYFGGPTQHSGLTGRKNAIDTYGEFSRHSGKALSGKDPLRIDRVGAYAARYAAKNVVAAGLASECEILLSYSIGSTQPVSLQVQTFGTGSIDDKQIARLIQDNFDFRLAAILRDLNLRHLPAMASGRFYQTLAAYGHFGRTDLELPWEKTDRAEALRAARE